jgi:hypothetical protein
MYKLWAKKIKSNKIIGSITIKNNEDISFSHKTDKSIKEICQKFDLSVPLWLEKHRTEFSEFKYVTFEADDFIDDIDFDKLEIELIEDKKEK